MRNHRAPRRKGDGSEIVSTKLFPRAFPPRTGERSDRRIGRSNRDPRRIPQRNVFSSAAQKRFPPMIWEEGGLDERRPFLEPRFRDSDPREQASKERTPSKGFRRGETSGENRDWLPRSEHEESRSLLARSKLQRGRRKIGERMPDDRVWYGASTRCRGNNR